MTDRNRPRHAVNRPMPGPIEIRIDETPVRVKRRVPLRRRWWRATKRGVASKRGKWTLAALAAAAIVLAGLLSQNFLSSPAPAATPLKALGQGATPTPGADAAAGAAGPGAASTRPSGSKSLVAGNDVLQTLKNTLPDNPLNHLRGAAVHQVVIETNSAEPVPVVGWLIPTGLSNTFGTDKNPSGHFSLSQRALGKGYLAAVFIQAGRTGAPVTCRVIVDGKVTASETTSGAYGRTICLG